MLFTIRLETRRVEILGITDWFTRKFSASDARNLVAPYTKPTNGVTHFLLDRNTKFTLAFKAFLKRAGVKVKRTPPGSPNYNAIYERRVGPPRHELLDHMVLFGESSIRAAINEFEHRNRLGGILRSYHRAAASIESNLASQ